MGTGALLPLAGVCLGGEPRSVGALVYVGACARGFLKQIGVRRSECDNIKPSIPSVPLLFSKPVALRTRGVIPAVRNTRSFVISASALP
ncbi:hypothetical protein AAFF_G00420070 [Aldrovandia affinis]|uniref:Uncharacterized protein n=1 Tax=Aldrovandia affinis TaxID=143900 RepID=A0AAD7SA88_9TELE|nr:hypothetical protein AAFF_G00420070 [Aldrovandia affinis]